MSVLNPSHRKGRGKGSRNMAHQRLQQERGAHPESPAIVVETAKERRENQDRTSSSPSPRGIEGESE